MTTGDGHAFKQGKGSGAPVVTKFEFTPSSATKYAVNVASNIENGTVSVDKATAAADEEVTVTATPTGNYKLDAITVTKAGGGTVEVTNGKFTMPAEAVTVSATFVADTSSDTEAVSAAKTAIATALQNFTVAQAEGNTEDDVKALVETAIATAKGNCNAEVTISAFTAATAGTKTNPNGENGSFSISVAVTRGDVTSDDAPTPGNGTITATAYVATPLTYSLANAITAGNAAAKTAFGDSADNIPGTAGAIWNSPYFSFYTESGNNTGILFRPGKGRIEVGAAANKNGIEFTTAETATVTLKVYTTSSKNTAVVALKNAAGELQAISTPATETTNVKLLTEANCTATGGSGGSAKYALLAKAGSAQTITYADLPAGTYRVFSPEITCECEASADNVAGRGVCVSDISVTEADGTAKTDLADAEITAVTLAETTKTMEVGAKAKVAYTVAPATAPNRFVKWSSGDLTKATVDEITGEITAMTAGQVTIKATSAKTNTVFGVCTVTVTGPAAGAAPVFADNGGNTYQVTKADAAAGTVSFTLKDAPTGAIYKLYAYENGVAKQINVSTNGVTADANKKITFTLDNDHKGLLTGTSAGTYICYVSSTEPNKGESDKTEASVELYVPVTGVTLKHMNEDGKTVSHVLYEKMKAGDPDVIGSAENESAKYPNGWKLVAVVAPEDATDKRVVFSNARVTPEFIEVAEDGTVTATKAGTGRIRVASVDDPEKFIAAEITVKVRIGAVEIQNADGTAAATTVAMGKTLPLKAVVTASASASQSHQEVEWKTSDATVATVSAAGVVTPVKPGTVKITATSKQDDTVKDELTLTVSKGTPALTFTTGNPQVTSGGKVRFKLEGVPAGVTPTFTVKQGDTAAAVTVYELDNDTDYNYYADMPENDTGATVTYTVTASVAGNDSWNAAEKSVEVKVLDVNAKNIYIVSPGTAKDVELAQGGDAKLEVIAQVNKAGGVKDDAATAALTYKWTKDGEAMSDATYAITVDTAGVYVCTVTSADEKVETKEVTVTFTVTQAAVTLTAIDVTPATGVDYTAATGALKITGPVDATFTVTTTPAEGHGDTLVAVSSTPSVARVTLVDGKLTVTPWSAGETTVTIRGTAAAEVKKEIKVTVVKAAAPAALTADDYTVTQPTVAGGKGTIKITQNAPDGTEYVYRKGDSGAWIKFPANKTIEVEPGTYKIRVYVPKPELQETTNGVAVEIKEFTAAPTVASVVVTSTADRLEEGKTLQLTAQVHMSNNTVSATETVTWTTSDATVATVSATGLVTGVKAGTVTVTATSTTDNTKKGSKTLTVTAKSGGGDEPTPPTPADKTALNKAIADATRLAKDTYTVADDTKVSQVNKGTQFVTEADQAKLAAAIADAKAVAAKADATEQEVADAEKALADAVTAFKAAVKTGTKSTNSGGSRPSANNGITTNKTTNNPAGGKTTVKKDSAGNVTITATDDKGEVIAEVKLPAHIPSVGYKFVDVPEGHWAESAINDMAGLELVKGVDETQHLFDMTSPITRGAVATILSRLANGKADVKDIFSDVAEGQWFAEGVAWAAKAGVVNGFEDGTFGPDGSITREQLAVMIARYAKLLGLDTTAAAGELADFTDAESIQSWAVEGMAWCVKVGIIQGRGNGVVDPSANATRAEATVMLGRLVDLLK